MRATITVPVIEGKIDADGHLSDGPFSAVADALDQAQRVIGRAVAEDPEASDWALEFVPESEAITHPVVIAEEGAGRGGHFA
jgi:hypothetical protein